MTEKKSFILYKDQRYLVAKLNNNERGRLLLAVYDYAIDGIEPNLPSKADIVFTAIKANLDRDSEKYDKICERRSEAGKLGAKVKKQRQENESNCLLEQANKTDNVNVNDNDNVNVNDNVNDNVNESLRDKRRSRECVAFGYTETAKRIISYLNEKAETSYSYDNADTLKHVKARLEEGFTEADFIKVIDNKVYEWKETSYERYLRPVTLFGTKFESYLNQKYQKTDYYVAPNENDLLPF